MGGQKGIKLLSESMALLKPIFNFQPELDDFSISEVFQIPFNLLNYEMDTVKFLPFNPAAAVKKGHYKHVKKLECIEVYTRNGKLSDFSIKT